MNKDQAISRNGSIRSMSSSLHKVYLKQQEAQNQPIPDQKEVARAAFVTREMVERMRLISDGNSSLKK